MYVDNEALPTFARRCRVPAVLVRPARRVHISKPAAMGLLLWAHAGTDKWTNTILLDRPCSGDCGER